MSLPTEAALRKEIPLASGFLDYFPDAAAAVAQLSRTGNEQHNPGKPLHWDRSKSGDEADALVRHLLQRGTRDTDGVLHSVKVAWRAMALLQKELEALYGLPLPRGAQPPTAEPRDDVVDAFAFGFPIAMPGVAGFASVEAEPYVGPLSAREEFVRATYEDGVKDEEDEAVPVFHRGEQVRITGTGRNYERTVGFHNNWVDSMDQYVGHVYTVEYQNDTGVALSCGYNWPPQVLERVHGD